MVNSLLEGGGKKSGRKLLSRVDRSVRRNYLDKVRLVFAVVNSQIN